jgi:hypothetical protein
MNHIYVAQMWEELFDHAVIKWQRIEFLNWLTHARAPSNYMSLYGTDFYQLTVNGPCLDLEQAAEVSVTRYLIRDTCADPQHAAVQNKDVERGSVGRGESRQTSVLRLSTLHVRRQCAARRVEVERAQ